MLRMLISSIWTAANTLLSSNENPSVDQPPTSKWRAIGKFLAAALSTIGIPFIQSMTESEALYECVNTLLSTSTATPATATRSHNNHRQRPNPGLSRHSRSHFRRRPHHNGGAVRIVKPTIHVHIH